MENAIIYAAMPWTATALALVHRSGTRKAKEARIRTALSVYVRHMLEPDFVLLWPDGTRS